jgi:DNA-binding LacI/PurR family transcriptional regulator
MPTILRTKDVTDLIEQRIINGEYSLRKIPSERELSEEIGVARMTARKALNLLVEKKVLNRKPTGRLEIPLQTGLKQPQIGLLISSFRSENAAIWRNAALRAAGQLKLNVRTIFYSSWDDLVLRDAIDGLDGVFLLPRSDPPPKWILKRLENHKCPIVVLEYDMTELGLPSIKLFPPIFIQQLLDYLYELGHRSIDCLNTQGMNPSTNVRIEQWKFWKKIHNVKGQLINKDPEGISIPRFTRNLFSKSIKNRDLDATAIMCTSTPAAKGVIRAIHDNGLTPGKDISVCAVDGELLSDLETPSLTSLERPDTTPYLIRCIEWMLSGEKWKGPKIIDVSGVKLSKGESTGPAPNGT